ncbi:MAG: hypothetical protein KKD05_02595 [Candidatus Omnitrophica bacterium]|nr:hypothetical protein [Candidatus Omnitrophota bacterium]
MIEKIVHNDIVIAVIIYKDHEKDGIQFVSPEDYSLQLGSMKRPKGYKILPHIHNPIDRKTVGTQEVLFVKKGKICIDFYSFEQVFLENRQLSAGDIILLVGAGHGIEVIEEAVIVEVKNGPYVKDADKGRFEGKKGA